MLAGASAAAIAAADGLVIASTSADYPVGTVIAAGSHVEVAAGQRIDVLDQTGEMFELTASGPYDGAGPAPQRVGETMTVADAAFRPGRRADIGGTRAEDHEACLEEARIRADLDAEDCARAFPPSPQGPALEVGLAVRAATFKPGDPLIFKLKASFDARVFCTAARAGENAETYALELSGGKAPLKLMGNVTAMAPQRGSPRLVAPDEAGDYVVSCFAVDPATWEAFETATAEIADANPHAWLLKSFADMRGAPLASGEVKVSVTE